MCLCCIARNTSSQSHRVYLIIMASSTYLPYPFLLPRLTTNPSLSTVAVALWVMDPSASITPHLELTVDETLEGGVGGVEVDNPVWSGEGRE